MESSVTETNDTVKQGNSLSWIRETVLDSTRNAMRRGNPVSIVRNRMRQAPVTVSECHQTLAQFDQTASLKAERSAPTMAVKFRVTLSTGQFHHLITSNSRIT